MKITTITLVFLVGLLNIAHADDQLTDQERSAMALLNSISDIVVAKIDAGSCYEMRGQYPIKIFTTGMVRQRRQNNMVTVKLSDRAVSVVAYPKVKIPEVGSQIITMYTRTSDYDVFDQVKNYDAVYSFNSTGSLLSMVGNLELFTNHSYLTSQAYGTEAKTSFSFSEQSSGDLNSTNIGRGSSQLTVLDYPKAKYQQRVQLTRDGSANSHTVFLRDLLSNNQSCRIKTETIGRHDNDAISEEGYLTVDMSNLDDPVVLIF
ncbi:hypothetical protein NP603_06905 [Methylomonas sp. SURF-1]|uniref:Outer membrane lipoprotein-sorting protein n=1 Tax=Methylomonas aurea TaxID=2952224 RepID=A0ABT1UGL2_9GAMM|nr:hypothetical protein [Methylomonas sp. SURF-1]MCQ8180830.1 hypothetical protein [Methylomonas sp. SURF-1]